MSARPLATVTGTGVSAALIARRLAHDGFDLRLAGRRPTAVALLARWLAEATGAEAQTASLDLASRASVAAALACADVVVHTAGPFAQTTSALVDEALRTGIAYVDLANELAATARLLARDDDAHAAGAVLVTGAGYGVAAAEWVALEVAGSLDDVAAIEVANAPAVAYETAGVRRTVIDALPDGGASIRDGRVRRERLGARVRSVPFAGGEQRVVAVPTGELLAVQRATDAGSVTVYSSELPSSAAVRAALPLLAALTRIPAARRSLQRLAGSTAPAELPEPLAADPDLRSRAWAHGVSRSGASATADLELGEGYAVTAAVAVACARAAIERGRPGAHTPASLLAGDLGQCLGAVAPRAAALGS